MRPLIFLFAVFVSTFADGQEAFQQRPKILGVASVTLRPTSQQAALDFYSKLLSEDHPCVWCGESDVKTFSINEIQFVKLSPTSLLDTTPGVLQEIAFATDNVPAMRRYLLANHIQPSTPAPQPTAQNNLPKQEDLRLFVTDPEGHRITFVQISPEIYAAATKPNARQLIHAGFVVIDRAVEDAFYKDILGFHVYWHGGRKDEDTSWVDMQVPDGTNWIEYMLGIPPNADKQTLGVMNHFAVGVKDIEVANYAIRKNGIASSEAPKIGRDGKWQLNFYDPDYTRVEFMEFAPTHKPCCSDYAGPHPGVAP